MESTLRVDGVVLLLPTMTNEQMAAIGQRLLTASGKPPSQVVTGAAQFRDWLVAQIADKKRREERYAQQRSWSLAATQKRERTQYERTLTQLCRATGLVVDDDDEEDDDDDFD